MKFKVFLAFVLVLDAAKAFTLNCDYGMETLIVIRDVYSCSTTDIPTSSGNIVTNVSGVHWDEKTNDDVEYIWLWGDWTLSFVPQDLGNFFPNIRAVSIWQSTIDKFYGDEFDQFPNLEWLNIFESNLTTISSRLFVETPKLSFISFMFTSLERVGFDLFTPLNPAHIYWVEFTGNPCVSQTAGDQEAINNLIIYLRLNCRFDDEETTTALITTTEGSLTCSEKRIEDLVCDLKDEMEEVQENLTTVKEETRSEIENLQNELSRTRNELQSANDKIKELENEQNKANEKIESQQVELTQVRRELQQKDQKIEEFESRILWLEEEVIRMVVNPCC